MRKILYSMMVLAAGLLAACNKDRIPDLHEAGRQESVSLRFEKAPLTLATKAEAIDTNEEDDLIDRLDVFVYTSRDTSLLDHRVFSNPAGIDLENLEEIKYYDVTGTIYYFFALTNLDAATADYLAGLSTRQIVSYSQGGLIPLEVGNFRAHRPIMGGTRAASLGKAMYSGSSDTGNRSVTITLYRYLARFEIENITADFNDDELMNSDVIIKGIVWTNVANALRPLRYFPGTYEVETGAPLWGSRSTYSRENEFGNLDYDSGYRYYEANQITNSSMYLRTTFNLSPYGATGALAADFPFIRNNNYQLGKGVLNVDAPGYMETATSHFFTGEEGRVCSSTNSAQSHVLNANKVFYIYPIARSSWSTYLCTEFSGQDDTIKMVIVVEINGKTYYYPYRVLYVQPNSRYHVKNITLKGLGSEYSNFYVKKYGAEVSAITVEGWDDLEVDNIDLGYKDYAGNSIY